MGSSKLPTPSDHGRKAVFPLPQSNPIPNFTPTQRRKAGHTLLPHGDASRLPLSSRLLRHLGNDEQNSEIAKPSQKPVR